MDRFDHMDSIAVRGGILSVLLVSVTGLSGQVLSLSQCIDSAMVNERRIQMAGTDERIAEERIREARGQLIPKLRGTADYRYYTDLPYQLMPASIFGGPADTYRAIQFGTPQNVSANIALHVPIYDPSAFGALQVTREAAAMATLQNERTREEVVMEVSAVYYNAQILQSKLAFLDSNVVNADALARTLELLHTQLLARGTDVDRLKLQRDQLLTQREQVRSQFEQVLDALRILTGMNLGTTVQLEDIQPAEMNASSGTRTTTGLRSTDQAIRLKHAELRAVQRARIPSLAGQGMYGTTGFGRIGPDDRFDFYPIGLLGLQLQVPLFQGTVLQHKIKGKKLELEKMTLQRDALLDKEGMERRTTERQITVAQQAITNGDAQLELAGRIRRNTVLQHREGVASTTELILADQSEREAQQNYLNALVDLCKAQLELQRLNGNLLK
ncbi:MAG TPA: TolC family protein [Flavobacteriales bacterium]|nr:TolC family protein [Flavobacteriales bacterium]HQW41459.1 TolC family protein [Flavobacteriales bacterium]